MTDDTAASADAASADAACEGDTIPGVLTGMNSPWGIQKCDECNLYPSDLDAALALAARVPGATVRYYHHSTDYGTSPGPVKTYDGTDTEAIIAPDTDPWIQIADGSPVGSPIDWTTYRLTVHQGVNATVTLQRSSDTTEIVRVFKVISEVPDVEYRGRRFQPDCLHVVYRHDHNGAGWGYIVNLSGPRRLKNGTLGVTHVRTWWTYGEVPGWASEIALANMPGELRIGERLV